LAEPALGKRETVAIAPDPVGRAAARYQEGRSAYAAGRYKDAIDCFREADSLAPSPALSFNTALAYDKLLDTSGALAHYREYLRRDAQAQRGDAVRARIRELESALAARGVQQVTVRSEPLGATVVVDDKPQGVTPWTGVLAPGEHIVALRMPGYSDLAQSFALPAEHAAALDFVLIRSKGAANTANGEIPPEHEEGRTELERRSASPWPWVAFGAGAASFLTAGVFELNRYSSATRAKQQTTQIGYDQAFREAQADRNKARAFAAIGGGLTLTGAILIFALRPHGGEQRGAALTCDPRGCTGSWRTAF
jgi:tetratricopeptide (TPR) repeat protein